MQPTRSAEESLRLGAASISPQREIYFLDAVASYVDSGDAQRARDTLIRVNPARLAPAEQSRREFLAARTDQLLGNHRSALGAYLRLSENATLPARDITRMWGYRAESELALGLREEALHSLGRQWQLEPDPMARSATESEIWRVLLSMSGAELTSAYAAEADPRMREWIRLAMVSDRSISTEQSLDQARANLNLSYSPSTVPGAPGVAWAPDQIIPRVEYRQIALLLPMSSRHEAAARAFHDGFMAAHRNDLQGVQPVVVLYDAGPEPQLAAQYYRTAVEEGADFIVGPLGTDASLQVLAAADITKPTLLLGRIGPSIVLPSDVFALDLGTEQEAEQAALRAWRDGHRFAGVMYAATEWGQRLHAAFADRWQALGGIVVESHAIAESAVDYSADVREFLRIVEIPPDSASSSGKKFIPRRRRDMDCVFIAAKYPQARLLKPQFDFFLAHDLPLYASSSVYAGRIDRINDADMEGLMFNDMPWVLNRDAGVTALRQSLQATGPATSAAALDRLFAAGIDSYNLVPLLKTLREMPGAGFHGVMAKLSVTAEGRVQRDGAWARFVRGAPELISDNVVSSVQP